MRSKITGPNLYRMLRLQQTWESIFAPSVRLNFFNLITRKVIAIKNKSLIIRINQKNGKTVGAELILEK